MSMSGEDSSQTTYVSGHQLAREGFTSASNYERVRKEYSLETVKHFLRNLRLLDDPEETIDDLSSPHRRVKILELGSGTGKFTRVMLKVLQDKNVHIIASEPLENMYEQFKLLTPETEIIQCGAENIDLPDASIDVVIACQCFHWFANPVALEEIHRVLVPRGLLGIFWLIPDYESVPWLREMWGFLRPLFNERGIIYPLQDWKAVFGLTHAELFGDLKEDLSLTETLPVSRKECYDYFSSYSVIVGGSETTKASFRQLFQELMKQHFEEKGIMLENLPFKAHIYWCGKE